MNTIMAFVGAHKGWTALFIFAAYVICCLLAMAKGVRDYEVDNKLRKE